MPNVGDRPGARELIPVVPSTNPALQPRTDRQRMWPETGTGKDADIAVLPRISASYDEINLWINRFKAWRDPFINEIAAACKKYWRLWRNFQDDIEVGPGQDWRDDTVVPEAAKVIFTRTPRFVMAQYGGREWAVCEASDPDYEEVSRQLIYQKFGEIGRGQRLGSFIERKIESMIYCQVMGHVWNSMTWREDVRQMRIKVPRVDADGKVVGWDREGFLDEVYSGLDYNWIPLDSLALNLRGPRRWAIERVVVSFAELVGDNEVHKEKFGRALYSNEALDALFNRGVLRAQQPEDFEPRDTEGWPTFNARADEFGVGPGDMPVELWLCWDNRRKTLAKIADRSVVLASGLAPTPDGMDPYWGVKAIIVPGRVYGDSILNWIGPLCKLQTRIKRARADEVLLNIWQQFIYRIGTITSPKLFMRPGGAMGLMLPQNEPLANAFSVLPRRPVFQEAYTEESYVQQQIEATAGADAVSMGVEATQKSRDVTAREIDTRQMQGAARYQVENLYQDASDKSVMLERAFDLLKQNLVERTPVQLPGEPAPRMVTNVDLQKPVNWRAGGGIYELSLSERRRDTAELVALAQTPLGARLKGDPILLEFFRARAWPRPRRFVKTDEEMAREAAAAQQMAMVQGMAGQGGANPLAGAEGALAPPVPPVPPESVAGGGAPPVPEGAPAGAEGMVEEL